MNKLGCKNSCILLFNLTCEFILFYSNSIVVRVFFSSC
uniref:Uncharacterized protein n=1 Tax=Anguilla anguilla TaxID=7936 RepID=A0A0E9PVZ9_ANGAN